MDGMKLYGHGTSWVLGPPVTDSLSAAQQKICQLQDQIVAMQDVIDYYQTKEYVREHPENDYTVRPVVPGR